MVKMSFTNPQTAFEYALYMIATSYFDKTTCRSELVEKNMLLQYKEQNINKQYQMEDICIAYMEKLVTKLPKELFKQNMEVRLKKKAVQSELTEIVLSNEECIMAFYGVYAGRKSKIDVKIWIKKPKKSIVREI